MDEVREAILNLFKKRFKGMSFNVVWISFLDPRFHRMKLLSQDEVQLARECLVDAAVLRCGIIRQARHLQNELMTQVVYGVACWARTTTKATHKRELTLHPNGCVLHVAPNLQHTSKMQRLFQFYLSYLYSSACPYVGQWMSALMPEQADCERGCGCCVVPVQPVLRLSAPAYRNEGRQQVVPVFHAVELLTCGCCG
ncbi:hypothetical protein GQ600_11201 [Phytophthora cactorum]|nr:hypothetical protein GQ600_11201 [Phytophthora cactorum]